MLMTDNTQHPMSSPNHRDPIYIRVLVFKESGQWLAQCLERDLVAQAPSEQEAMDSFIRLLKGRLVRDLNNGKEPLQNLPPAPSRFLDAWNRLTNKHDALSAKSVSLPDDGDIPDAYVISQIAGNGDSGAFHP
jgi:hypothetical protein